MSTKKETDLTVLRRRLGELWREKHLHHDMGGRWSMAGFALQSQLFLLRFFSGIKDGRREPVELAEMERLSDILVPNDNGLSLVQVKRTLEKHNLIASLKEAYLITQMCCEELPEALERISFQIACRRRATRVTPAQIAPVDVLNDEYDADTWGAMLERFHEIPIVEEPDYSNQLYLLLWNVGLRDPRALLTECLGRMLDAAEDPDYRSAPLARELANLYHAAARREHWNVPGQILTANDVAPEPGADALHGVLYEQRVTLEHLRKGYVKQRPVIFNSLLSAFDIWRDSVETADEEIADSTPVFWIAGRSGDGKSVLLLQLVQRMLQQNPDLPVMLLPSGNRLPEFLENAPPIDQTMPVIAIDDVYDINDRDTWEERMRESCQLGTPRAMLITCGPTEQCDQFSADLSDLFKVTRFVTPQIEAQEQDEFVAWYTQRTGEEREREALTSQNVLLVQVLFELVQGERIPIFAKKLARRLQRLGLFTKVRTIVAINALYKDAPVELLGEERPRRALERLCAKDQLHFRINLDATGRPCGVRLAHAHLAWLLFQEWADTDGITTIEQAWAAELDRALTSHLECGRDVQAGSLLYQLLISARLHDEPEVKPNRIDTIREIYRLHLAANRGTPHVAVLPRWLNLVYRFPALSLKPDPAEIAARMLANADNFARIHSDIAGWLWRVSATGDLIDRNRLRKAAKEFFTEHPETPGIASALVGNASLPDEEGLAVALNWLRHNGEAPEAYHIVAQLEMQRSEDQEICDMATGWLEDHPDHPHAYHLIAPLVTKRGEEQVICDIAIGWLEDHPEHPQAYQVIAPLVRKRGKEQVICDIAIGWLEAHGENANIWYVLENLLGNRKDDSEIIRLAKEWLDKNPAHSRAAQVLIPLASCRDDSAGLCDYIRSWLTSNPNDVRYSNVLGALTANSDGDPKILALAEGYLEHCKPIRKAEIIAALLYGGHASPKYVRLALGFISELRGQTRATPLLVRLGKRIGSSSERSHRVPEWRFHRSEQSHSVRLRSLWSK